MRHILFYISILFCGGLAMAQTTIKDGNTNEPIPYATISFGNGNGIFADDAGMFIFTKKLYPDIDSLFISALGYKDLGVATENLPKNLLLEPHIDQLEEVVLNVNVPKENRKFKKETQKPYLDDDYYKCWLPTIESEIAVFFPNETSQDKEIATIHFPITLESKDWEKRKKANADKQPFSTLFKVKFYENKEGFPGDVLTYENIVFVATEKHGDVFELDVTEHKLDIPDNGFFVSLQVLGYTDKNGKLLPNKKYKEVKSRNGILKIPTNFRPLLPFTDEIAANNTYIKRVFLNDNEWVRFEKGSGIESSLLKSNLTNYGIGVTYKVFKED